MSKRRQRDQEEKEERREARRPDEASQADQSHSPGIPPSSAASLLNDASYDAPANLPAKADVLRGLQGTIGNAAVASVAQSKGRPLSYAVDVTPGTNGKLIPPETRAPLEAAFEADFSDVQVHEDGQAEKLGAEAFTAGSDVHFARGRFDPSTESGQRLLAHELAHVMQQRAGKVDSGGSRPQLVDDRRLEGEADESARMATRRTGEAAKQGAGHDQDSGSAAPRAGDAVQGAIPAALAAIGTWLGAATTAQAATSVGAMLAVGYAGASVGAALMPGQTGVQEVQLENGWMSNTDKQKLALIAQYRLINAYVARWIRAHGGTPSAGPATAPAGAGTPAATAPSPTPAAPIPTESPPTGAPSAEAIDAALMEAVKTEVQLKLEEDLNANQADQVLDYEFIWSDSGSHSADWIGTVGAIEFVGLKGTYLMEGLVLSEEARQIPNLDPPRQWEVMFVKQFRGGRLVRSSQMETGLGDELGVNLVGSGPSINQAGDDGHGVHTYDTAWNWDDNTTHWAFDVWIPGLGAPFVIAQRSRGEPED